MEFSSDVIRTVLIYGGIPALALLVFYGLLRGGWGSFKFEPIGSTMAGVIALAFLAVLAFIAYIALTRFDAPQAAAGYTHGGELGNLMVQVNKDRNAAMVIQLQGTDDERAVLQQLYFEETTASSYSTLLEKLCAAKARCIKCNVGTESPIFVTISKVGEISPHCKVEGVDRYCCA